MKHISTTPHTSMWNGLRKILLHLLFLPHIFIHFQLLFLGFQEGRQNKRIDLLIQKHRLLAVTTGNLECFLQFIFFLWNKSASLPWNFKARSPYLHAMEWSLNQGREVLGCHMSLRHVLISRNLGQLALTLTQASGNAPWPIHILEVFFKCLGSAEKSVGVF